MRRQAGSGKFEFAVVLVIFGVLAHLLLGRLLALERETERLEVALTVRHIGIGLKLAVGERIMRGEESRIADLLAWNPLDFLGRTDESAPAGTAAAMGNWRYDAGAHLLAYSPRQPEAFDGRQRLAWRLQGHTDELGRTVGLRLEPLN